MSTVHPNLFKTKFTITFKTSGHTIRPIDLRYPQLADSILSVLKGATPIVVYDGVTQHTFDPNHFLYQPDEINAIAHRHVKLWTKDVILPYILSNDTYKYTITKVEYERVEKDGKLEYYPYASPVD